MVNQWHYFKYDLTGSKIALGLNLYKLVPNMAYAEGHSGTTLTTIIHLGLLKG